MFHPVQTQVWPVFLWILMTLAAEANGSRSTRCSHWQQSEAVIKQVRHPAKAAVRFFL